MVGAQRYLGDNLLHFPVFSQHEKEQGGGKKGKNNPETELLKMTLTKWYISF